MIFLFLQGNKSVFSNKNHKSGSLVMISQKQFEEDGPEG